VLFSCLPGYGHFNRLVPLARAFGRAGHPVAFATAAAFGPRVAAAGFDFFPTGLSMADQLDGARLAYPTPFALPPGQARFEAFVPAMLAGVAAPARAADLIPLARWWRPDLVVHDEAEMAAPLAARLIGVGWASASIVLRRPPAMAALAGEIIAPLYRRFGAEPDPMAGLYRYAHLDACPPALQPPRVPAPAVTWALRDTGDGDTAPGDTLPAWVASLPPRPTVYLTLGTLFNRNRAVLSTLLAGVADLEVNVIATVGTDNQATLGPYPEHIHLLDYLPLSLLAPHVDVVVTQGGTSVLTALAAGRPMLVVPQGADQFHNAEACVAAGVALRLLPAEVDPAAVAEAVQRLLDDALYTDKARGVAAEVAAMPGPDDAVPALQRLAATAQPLPGGG
jgi:UDP:flavonoid glycosyltransferase YjiC (YdhE family)